MWTLVVLGIHALFLVHATLLSQELGRVHIHAKYGDVPEKYENLSPVDEYASLVATKYIKIHIPKLEPLKIGFIDSIDVKLPQLNIPRPVRIQLKNLIVTGLDKLQLPYLEFRTGSNRLDFNASFPELHVEVLAKLAVTLDENFDHNPFASTIRFKFRLSQVRLAAAFHYKTEKYYAIDNADVNIDIGNTQVSIGVIVGLEELRYLIAELFNNRLDTIGDAVLEEVLSAINRQLTKFTTDEVNKYLSPPRTVTWSHFIPNIQNIDRMGYVMPMYNYY